MPENFSEVIQWVVRLIHAGFSAERIRRRLLNARLTEEQAYLIYKAAQISAHG